jgi:hypothetical protein
MYEFAGSKSAKLVVTESRKLVARFLQYIACYVHVKIYNKSSHGALCLLSSTVLKDSRIFLLVFL